jgi:hypothetical protein
MNDPRWLDVIARLSADDPTDLDPVLGPAPAPPPAPHRPPDAPAILSARLWTRNPARSYIGILVSQPPADIRSAALRLAAAAVERGVVPIILSALPRTGFEPYGFRVERLPAGPPEARALHEDELRRFWDMALVFDLAEVDRLA